MTKSLVCCQEDVRVKKTSFRKGRERMFFLLISFLVLRICRIAISLKQICRVFLTTQILESLEGSFVRLLNYKASLKKMLYHCELPIRVTDSMKHLSNMFFQPGTMCKALRRQNRLFPQDAHSPIREPDGSGRPLRAGETCFPSSTLTTEKEARKVGEARTRYSR